MFKFVYKSDCSMGKKGDTCSGIFGSSLLVGGDGQMYEKQYVQQDHALQTPTGAYRLHDASCIVEVRYPCGYEDYFFGDLVVDEDVDVFEVMMNDDGVVCGKMVQNNSGIGHLGEVCHLSELRGLEPFTGELKVSKREKIAKLLKADVDDELLDKLMEVVGDEG